MDKKVPKVGEKIIVKIYGSLVQVIIKSLEKVKGGYRYKGELKGREGGNNMVANPITIEGFMDENCNYGD